MVMVLEGGLRGGVFGFLYDVSSGVAIERRMRIPRFGGSFPVAAIEVWVD